MAASTLFAQAAPSGAIQADTAAYTMGIQFSVSAPAALSAIWWYSPAGATELPETIALFAVSGASLVASQAASWSGAAGSGWVRAAFASPPSLSAGVACKGCVLKTGAGNHWYSEASAYWSTGPGSAGITSGPLSAPNNAGGDGGQDTFHLGATLTYPAASFSAANYWVDVEVTAVAAGSAHLAASPLLSSQAVITRAGHGALAASPALNAVAILARTAQSRLAAQPLVSSLASIARPGHAALTAGGALGASATISRAASARLAAGASLGASGSVMLVIRPAAALSALPVLAALATAGPDLAALWNAYLELSEKARRAEEGYGMMRQAGGTDGSAGFLFGKAYRAQQAADQAYAAWQAAQRRVYPGARG